MSQARSALRAYVQLDPDPAVLLSRLDALADTLLDDGEARTAAGPGRPTTKP